MLVPRQPFGVLVLVAATLLLAMSGERAWGQDTQSAEYRIKAAFLCKFGN